MTAAEPQEVEYLDAPDGLGWWWCWPNDDDGWEIHELLDDDDVEDCRTYGGKWVRAVPPPPPPTTKGEVKR